MAQIYLKGKYGSNRIVPRYKFIKNISRSHKKTFYETLSRIPERTILFQCYYIPSEFTENVCKYNANQTILDKYLLN